MDPSKKRGRDRNRIERVCECLHHVWLSTRGELNWRLPNSEFPITWCPDHQRFLPVKQTDLNVSVVHFSQPESSGKEIYLLNDKQTARFNI